MKFHLAQINVALGRAPLESELMSGFTNALNEINALADAAPGFIWRLKTEAGDATSIRAFPDPRMIVNLSVWRDVPSLKDYAYRSSHGRFFARRAEWFERKDGPHLALWWMPEGTLPTLEEAKARLAAIGERGDSEYAFTFRSPFDAPKAAPT